MRYAFSSLGCPDKSIEQIAEMAQTYGYQAVSIRTVSGTPNLETLPEFSDDGLQKTKALFDRHNVSVLCMASGVRFNSPDADEREQHVEAGKRYIEMAQALGAPYMRVFGGPIKPEMELSAVHDNIADGMSRLVQYAETRGVTVLLETHDSFSTGKSIRDLFEATGLRGVSVVWDILHSLRFGESFEETWKHVGQYVKHVHIKDSATFDSSGFDIKLCGEGTVPIGDALALLRREAYDGYLEFEWEKGWHREIPEAEIAFPHYIAFMNNLEKTL